MITSLKLSNEEINVLLINKINSIIYNKNELSKMDIIKKIEEVKNLVDKDFS